MTFLRAIATTASILALTAAAAAAPASSNAYQMIGSDNEIHDLTTFELFSALNERGINAEHAEAWGQAIRVDAIDETGRSYLLILDKNTLRPIGDNAARISTVQAAKVSGFQWPETATGSPNSLVAESEDNGSTETSND